MGETLQERRARLRAGGAPSRDGETVAQRRERLLGGDPKKVAFDKFSHHHGISGLIENAAGDVGEIATGTVPGLVGTAKAVGTDVSNLANIRMTPHGPVGPSHPFEHSTDIAKQIAQSYIDRYGSWEKAKKSLYNDPVFVVLDALTVASGGTSAAVKLGVLDAKAGQTLELASGASKVSKPLAKNEMRAQLQALTAKAGNAEINLGSFHRPAGLAAAKIERTSKLRDYQNVRASNEAFNRSLRRMGGKPAKQATALLARYDRQALDEYVTTLKGVAAKEGPSSPAAKTVRIIEHPRVQALFDKPTDRMAQVLDEIRSLGDTQQGLLGIDDATAEARKFLPARIASGATFAVDPDYVPKIGTRVTRNGKGGRVVRMEEDGKVRVAFGSSQNALRYDPSELDFPNAPHKWVGGTPIEELKARGLDPAYLPDSSTRTKEVGEGAGSGGIGVPTTIGAAKQNKGILALAGQLVLDPSVLNESFLKAAKFHHYTAIHDRLLEIATPTSEIRSGMTFIRKKRSERINPLDKSREDFNEWADTNLDKHGDNAPKGHDSEGEFTTTREEDAAKDESGRYLVVPTGVAKTMAGEFTRQSKLAYTMNRYPLRVWRALILGLKPAYLVNNMIGNTLMYLVHSGRPEDLKQLAVAFKRFARKGEHGQIDALLEKHFAGQVRGGFTATQFPEYSGTRRIGKAAGAVVGAIPHLDRRWEQALRRGKVIAELKRHPALREHAVRMGTETASFERLAKSLEDHPEFRDQVYDRVNDALGNYDNMTRFEKNVLRNIFPFLAWYRSIAGVSLKLAIAQPLKVNLLGHLAQIAVDQNLASTGLDRGTTPSSLLGFIPTGHDPDGRVRGFNTSSLNPYGTDSQLADFVAALASGKPGAAGKTLPGANPLGIDLLSYIFGQTPGGYPAEAPGLGIVGGLPQKRLFDALTGRAKSGNTLYDHDGTDELLRFLGVPYARVSPSAAKKIGTR